MSDFSQTILAGIPDDLPAERAMDPEVSHAPVRKPILTKQEEHLALNNALRYFPAKHHATLAPEFAKELKTLGRIYMHRFRPTYAMKARPIVDYPAE